MNINLYKIALLKIWMKLNKIHVYLTKTRIVTSLMDMIRIHFLSLLNFLLYNNQKSLSNNQRRVVKVVDIRLKILLREIEKEAERRRKRILNFINDNVFL